MQQISEPTIKKVELGKLKIVAVFKTDKGEQIVGGNVKEGKVEANSFIEVIRGTELLAKGKLTRLQSGKQDVNSVEAGQQCGIQYEGKPVIQKGDTLLFYKEEKIISKT